LIGRPDRSFHCERRMFWRSRTPKTKTGYVSRDYWSGIRKEIGRRRWNDQCQNCNAEQDLTTSRIDKLLRGSLVSKESGSWKEKISEILCSLWPEALRQRTLQPLQHQTAVVSAVLSGLADL
jgi:hypothetical protein